MIYDVAIPSHFRMHDTRRQVVLSEHIIKGLEMGLELNVVRPEPSPVPSNFLNRSSALQLSRAFEFYSTLNSPFQDLFEPLTTPHSVL